MSSPQLNQLPLPGKVPNIVSQDPNLLTAWEAINAWCQTMVEKSEDVRILASHSCLIMMACKFINLRAQQLVNGGSAAKLDGVLTMKKMQAVSAELKSLQAVTAWLGQRNSMQGSVEVGNVLYNTLFQQRNQSGAPTPLPKARLLPVERIWTMISLTIEIAPEPETVKSSEAKDKLFWLRKQSDDSLKRPFEQAEGHDASSKKARTSASTAANTAAITSTSALQKRIEVLDPQDIETIKRYDPNIGIVPIEGPVKNRGVVTAYDVLTLAPGQQLNDAVIDAHLTLVCHTSNGLFQEGGELPLAPKYHAWSAQMSLYLVGRAGRFEEKHLRQEWPPARFPQAKLEDVPCHIFPVHVEPNHWVLMVLQMMEDGQRTLVYYSSVPGFDQSFQAPWQVISSWLLFKSKGAVDVTNPRVLRPDQQPKQNNKVDCGVFVCGIVRWSVHGWDLSTLTPSIIPDYRRRMILEIERWRLSMNQL